MSHASSKATTVPFNGRPFTPLSANRWQGETGVIVGPFSSEKLAHYFAETVLSKDPSGTLACYVFRRANDWFVDICSRKPGPWAEGN